MKALIIIASLALSNAARAEINLEKGQSIEHNGETITCGLERPKQEENHPNVFCSRGRNGRYCYLSATQSWCYSSGEFNSESECGLARENLIRTREASYSCYLSQSEAGKAYLQKVNSYNGKIQNYFPSLDSCILSAKNTSRNLVCFASESRPGQFFIGNIDTGGAPIGSYYSSQEECLRALR